MKKAAVKLLATEKKANQDSVDGTCSSDKVADGAVDTLANLSIPFTGKIEPMSRQRGASAVAVVDDVVDET